MTNSMKKYLQYCPNLMILPTISRKRGVRRATRDFYCKKTSELCEGNHRPWFSNESALKLNIVEECTSRLEDLTLDEKSEELYFGH